MVKDPNYKKKIEDAIVYCKEGEYIKALEIYDALSKINSVDINVLAGYARIISKNFTATNESDLEPILSLIDTVYSDNDSNLIDNEFISFYAKRKMRLSANLADKIDKDFRYNSEYSKYTNFDTATKSLLDGELNLILIKAALFDSSDYDFSLYKKCLNSYLLIQEAPVENFIKNLVLFALYRRCPEETFEYFDYDDGLMKVNSKDNPFIFDTPSWKEIVDVIDEFPKYSSLAKVMGKYFYLMCSGINTQKVELPVAAAVVFLAAAAGEGNYGNEFEKLSSNKGYKDVAQSLANVYWRYVNILSDEEKKLVNLEFLNIK